ncbi:MAG: mechanosensitive ion channel [Terracidiphilus sp.]|nr:mechanosensitive ion channel [Terracidiphilus sp.]
MAILPVASSVGSFVRNHILGRARVISLLVLIVLLGLCLAFSWTTRDAMANLPFLSGKGQARGLVDSQKTLVDLRPWQTAEALAALAVTAEETEFAHEAEHLADHEVDQAFASALRLASAQVQRRNLTGEALALSQKVAQLQQFVKGDQAQVQSLTSASPAKDGNQATAGNDDLEIAKAQLGLDTDQLDDAQLDLARASGDNRSQIQSELTAHETAMRKYDSELHGDGQVAVLSARQHGTLASRVKAWTNQRNRYQLIQVALQQAQSDVARLTTEHKTLEAAANTSAAATAGNSPDSAARLASIKGRSEERQVLSIYDDRILTEQQLAAVYSKWSVQVLLQHRIVLHLALQSLALIVFILICVVSCDALVRRLMEHPALDRRQVQTLRTIIQLGIQVLGGLLILFVIFGSPRQISTILGLATAGLTIALQDFILAFFGWFVLIGKKGIRVGDWVEIDGVGGEVTEVGLMSTTLLETGDSLEKGRPTGRSITILNSYAIRGKFFIFATSGQWMWDEISVAIPASEGTQALVEHIRKTVQDETRESASIAEHEWKRGSRVDGLSRFSATPVVNLRPSESGIEIHVRYVTRASERFVVRNHLYQHVINLLQKENKPAETDQTHVADNVQRP